MPCKLLNTWGSKVAPRASSTALQLSLDPFASGGDESYYRGVLLLELVLCLELGEVVLLRPRYRSLAPTGARD
jgi:hypothetical protein